MKGVRFYEEFDTRRAKRKGQGNGQVIAVLVANGVRPGGGGTYDAIGCPTYTPNGMPCGVTATRDYLREKCRRIPEARAREIHPNLFTMLDDEP